ncbi:MAG: class I SAM-dependent methyltransferase [Candidatus Nanohaloarchaea archaeon]|nr:class I SAM-dependent methyltransferase [Candidatus Nanohaloarchaea archaeon]
MSILTPEEFYSEEVEEYDEKNALENLPDNFKDLLDSFSSKVGSGKILDVGCGTGRDTNYFAERGFEAVGIDIAPGMIRYAKENYEGEFIEGDMRYLAFDETSFDGVWANASVFLLPKSDWESAIGEIHRVMKDNSVLQINFKIGEGELEKERDDSSVKQYLAPEDEIDDLLEDKGFEITSYERHETYRPFDFGNYFCRK